MGKKNIQQTINVFTSRVKKTLAPKQVILFGSYARGDANEYSDVDFIVISDKFVKMSEDKRSRTLYKLTENLCPDIHAIGMTPNEYENLSPLISISEAKREGITLVS